MVSIIRPFHCSGNRAFAGQNAGRRIVRDKVDGPRNIRDRSVFISSAVPVLGAGGVSGSLDRLPLYELAVCCVRDNDIFRYGVRRLVETAATLQVSPGCIISGDQNLSIRNAKPANIMSKRGGPREAVRNENRRSRLRKPRPAARVFPHAAGLSA